MATVGSLVVTLLLQNAQFLRQMSQTAAATGNATRQMQANMAALRASWLTAGKAFGAFLVARGLASAVKQVADYSDAWKVASNQIAAADSISNKQARSMAGIVAIAAATRTSLQETTELYAKMLRSTDAVAKSEAEVARVTEIVAKAFKAGGASTQEQVNGIRQLSQALASGVLQGDELRSLRENAPLLAQAIATEFSTTIGGLKKLGAEGELTADRVFKAILQGSKPIDAAFAATSSTIAESFTVLNNSITAYVGKLDEATGASRAFTSFVLSIANNFEGIVDKIFFVKEIGLFIENIQLAMAIIDGFGKKIDETAEGPLTAILGRWKDWTDASDQLEASLSELIGVDIDSWIAKAESALGRTNPFADFLKLMKDLNVELKKVEVQVGNITEVAKTVELPKLFTIPKVQPKLEGFKRSGEQFMAEIDLRDEIGQMKLLSEAAKQGQDAFDIMTDMIWAFNEALKAGLGNPLINDQAAELMATLFQAKQLSRQDEPNIEFGKELTDVKNSVEQYRSLSVALGQSADEYRALKDHLDLINEAAEKNIDLTTAQGQAWMAQREAAQQLEHVLERQKELYDEVANTINSTVNSAIGNLSSAFADAVVQGESFRDMLDALLKDLAKLALNSAFQLFLKQIIGGIGTTSTGGTGLLGMLLGGIGGGALGQGGLPLVPGGTFGDTITPQAMGSTIMFHRGGVVGKEGSIWDSAPRFHKGLMPNEFPAVLNRGEGVFTNEQMKALGGNKGDVNINIDNRNGSDVQAKGEQDENGNVNIEVVIDQVVGRKLLQPGAASNRAMKQGFGAQPVGIRR